MIYCVCMCVLCKCVFVSDRERDRGRARKRGAEVQLAQFQVPTVYYNGILIYCNFSSYFKLLITFSLSCTET